MREEYPGWGRACWNIPSGAVEAHESPAEGAARELAEETGLVVAPGDLVLHGTTEVTSPGHLSRAWNFTVTVEDPALRVEDPDELIREARWFGLQEAIRLLRDLPYRPLSEPAVAMLTEHAPRGTHWAYADPRAQPVVTPGG